MYELDQYKQRFGADLCLIKALPASMPFALPITYGGMGSSQNVKVSQDTQKVFETALKDYDL